MIKSYKSWKESQRQYNQFKRNEPILYWLQQNVYYSFLRQWRKLLMLPKEIKWFIQRGKRGWADCDTWDLFVYNAKIMSESLKYLSQHTTAYPEKYSYKKWRQQLMIASTLFDQIYLEQNTPQKLFPVLRKLCKIMEDDYLDWWD